MLLKIILMTIVCLFESATLLLYPAAQSKYRNNAVESVSEPYKDLSRALIQIHANGLCEASLNLQSITNQICNRSIVAIIKHICDYQSISPEFDNMLEMYRKEIKVIDFSLCSWLTNDGLYALAEICLPLIKTAFLTDCYQLTDEAVCYFLDSCPNLEFLSFAGCNQITDQSIEALAKSCKFLKVLDLTGCRRLYKVSVLKKLQNDCKQLRDLRINGTAYNLNKVFRNILR